jgi:hypothetical protein
MHKSIFAAVILMLLAFPVMAAAQDTPKAEVFGGYSLLHTGTGFVGSNASGWEGSASGNLNRWFGVTADFSGYYNHVAGIGVHDHNFLFGPTLSLRTPVFTPFGHALFGDSHVGGGGFSDNAFATAIGGGVDWNVNHLLALRLIQADYLMTRFASTTQNNGRFSVGVVFKFGGK